MTNPNKLTVVAIKITKPPEGKAPLEIRKKWVGLRLVGAIYQEGLVKSGVPKKHRGFVVLIDDALQALKRHNKDAYYWWSHWRAHHPDSDVFLFGKGSYKILTEVEDRKEFLDAFKEGGALEEVVDYVMKH